MPPSSSATVLVGLLCFMNQPETIPPSVWKTAEQKCWRHVEVSTKMMRLMTALGELPVASVIPILSDHAPSLMITPDDASDLARIKAVCRVITASLGVAHEWQHITINDEWLLRLVIEGINIDIMTRLPATKESPIEV